MTVKKKVSKKKTVSKKKPEGDQVSKIVSQVVEQLKPEISKKIDTLRDDLLADVNEKIKKTSVAQPSLANGADVSGLLNSLKGGNLDLGDIGKMMGNMAPQMPPMDPSKMDPDKYAEIMKSQQQNQMLMMILPKLFESQTQSPLLGEMMQRFFMENMMDGMNQRKAFTTFAMKLAGDPKLMQSYQQQSQNISAPITDALSKPPGAMGNGQQG